MTTESRTEGATAEAIEEQTSKIPSDWFLWSAGAVMATSIGLFCAGKKHAALIAGQSAISILLMGTYNKIVKVAGHDKDE